MADTHCYLTPGPVMCAEDGTADAAYYAEIQKNYYEGMGKPDPGPQPVPEYMQNPTTTTTSPVPMQCFVVVGGNPCFPVGSPDAERAAQMEIEYREFMENELTPDVLQTTTTTAPPASSETSLTPEVVVVYADETTTEIFTPPVPASTYAIVTVAPPTPVTLPSTGAGELIAQSGMASLFLCVGVLLVKITRRRNHATT